MSWSGAPELSIAGWLSFRVNPPPSSADSGQFVTSILDCPSHLIVSSLARVRP